MIEMYFFPYEKYYLLRLQKCSHAKNVDLHLRIKKNKPSSFTIEIYSIMTV